jgi:hypothetical protein
MAGPPIVRGKAKIEIAQGTTDGDMTDIKSISLCNPLGLDPI